MDLSRWPDADAILDRALGLPVDERLPFVRSAAAHDSDLALALEAVLAEASSSNGFLRSAGALEGEDRSAVSTSLPPGPSPALAPGARLEQYEVIALIGRGGMGEVYRARDLRLERDVALKVLPEMSSRDEERRARFRREARVLAMLSHPGIGAIYGVAETPALEALVLELVEGPTLAERLAGQPLPLAVTIEIARHLVDAVAAAHARGILHRDLKPANIKVLPNDRVKVLDFGLAKALAPDRTPVGPDLTVDAPHRLLGTASYMSPEQIRGHSVDARADVWAFGCVLFEMLTGARAFDGRTVNDVLARVMEREPAFDRLPGQTPESIWRLLRRTLEKDVSRRLSHIADARLDLDDALVETPSPPRARSRLSRAIIAAILLTVAIGGAAIGWLASRAGGNRAPAVSRFVIPLRPGDSPVTGFQPMLALSPDGRTLVYRARRDGVTRLYRRVLGDLEAQPIAGTENATGPFFSPDGRWLAFDSDGVLKRAATAGGTPVVIASAPGGATSSWAADDSIVFSTNTARVLQRIAASGGAPEALTTLDAARGDTLHALPQVLPDGRTVIFTIVAGAGRQVAALDLPSRRVSIITEGSHARVIAPHHLVFARDGTLWGATLGGTGSSIALAGQPIPLVEGVEHTDNTVVHYDVSSEGSIAYLPAGQLVQDLQRLVWADRQGQQTAVTLEPRPYTRISLAPDGNRLAFAMSERGNTDIWVADPDRRTTSRLTTSPTIETSPTWSPDGRYIAFRSEREGPGLFRQDAQGAGPVERLTTTDGPIHSPYSWTPDGRTLLIALFRSFNRQAIGAVTPPDPAVQILLDGEFAQLDPQVSPDGRWLAYQSDETGRFEIYVRPYPGVKSGRWQVSSSGGTSPRFSPDGREIFYYDGGGLVSVAFSAASGRPTRAAPVRLFPIAVFGGRLGPDYEVAPDGRRFLFIVEGQAAELPRTHLVYVQHWEEELRSRLGER